MRFVLFRGNLLKTFVNKVKFTLLNFNRGCFLTILVLGSFSISIKIGSP
jgi:hypothetical protein